MVGGTKRDNTKKKAKKTTKTSPANDSSKDELLKLTPMKMSKELAATNGKTNGNGKVAVLGSAIA
jgi:hypothetical protein